MLPPRPWPKPETALRHEFDCYCCHGPEVHEIDPVKLERGRCLVPDCVHGCRQYIQQKKSSFFELLDAVEGILHAEEKRKALLAEEWSLEDWLERFRGEPWPEKRSPKTVEKSGDA